MVEGLCIERLKWELEMNHEFAETARMIRRKKESTCKAATYHQVDAWKIKNDTSGISSLFFFAIFSFTLSPRQRNHLTCNQSWENILNREFDQSRLIHRGWWSIFSFWITIFERYRKEMSFFKRNFLGNFDGIKWKIFYDILSLIMQGIFFFFFFLNAKRNERCVFLHVRCTNPYFAGDKDWNYECVKR